MWTVFFQLDELLVKLYNNIYIIFLLLISKPTLFLLKSAPMNSKQPTRIPRLKKDFVDITPRDTQATS